MEGMGKRRVYVAGPMSGYKNWNFEAFDAAAADLRSRGYEVINPVDLDRDVGFDPATSSPEDFDLPAAIKRDIEALITCHAIVMLPGHENSKGATAERHVAQWGGLDVLVYPSLVKYGDQPLPAEGVEFYLDDGKPSGMRPIPEEKRRELLESFGVEDTGPSHRAVKDVAYVPADFADDNGVKEWLGRNGVKPEDIRVVHDRESLGDKIVEFAEILKDHQTTVQPLHLPQPQSPIETQSDDEDILAIAYRITRGDRQSSYGPPNQDFRRTAEMWTALFKDNLKDGKVFEPFHVAQFMILIKMSRQLHQRKADNWIDVAGYARCGWICDTAAKKAANSASP